MPTRTNITAPIHRRKFVNASAATVFAPALARAQGQLGNDNDGWGMLTRADRDAAYNNAAAVSDSTQIMARMSEASAKLRGQRPKLLDLPYGAGERARWDLFPSDNPKAPILVHIHGGYWQTRKRDDFSCLAEGVLARGWSAALPGYTLAPAANLAQIAQEMRNALDWLTGQGSAHRMTGSSDKKKAHSDINYLGDSSGRRPGPGERWGERSAHVRADVSAGGVRLRRLGLATGPPQQPAAGGRRLWILPWAGKRKR